MKRLFNYLVAAVIIVATAFSVSSCDKEDETKYTVSFNSKGGTPTPQDQTIKIGGKVVKPADPTRDNYSFRGWAKADNETSELWNFDTETVTGDMTLYAQWSIITHLVTFNSDGGSAVSPQNVAHGGTATKPADPTRNGYAFDGWFNGNMEWNFSTVITAPITLTAKWSIAHIVTFNSDGGSIVPSQIIRNGGIVTKPANPTKNNFAFVEWRKEGENTAFDFNTPITASITLKAVWLDPNAIQVTNTSEGTVLSGGSLSAKLDWIDRRAESHNTYIVVVNTNESIAPRIIRYSGAINITIIIRGDGTNRTIRLSSHGHMFTVYTNVSFILENNITLQGHSQNTGSMVRIEGGILKMKNGAAITDNYSSVNNGGGVYIYSGVFEMSGGTISGNTAIRGGGVNSNGTFTMTGGTISGNTASEGGGVYVFDSFTMTDGTISGNTANEGGGVYIGMASFTMHNGTITGNTASAYGGGVYTNGWGTFTKTGGTITGFNTGNNSGFNKVHDGTGIIARRGHAAYVESSFLISMKRKETTAGPNVNLSSDSAVNWDE